MMLRTKHTKALLALFAVAILAISVAAVAFAQGDGSSAQTASQASSSGDVPEGPYIDFCPTHEQIETHFQKYGFDYKPSVSCSREGEVPSPGTAPGESNDDDLSATARCAHDKQQLESAKPVPDSDGDPTTMTGELPNGTYISISVMTAKPELYEGQTVRDQAKEYPC